MKLRFLDNLGPSPEEGISIFWLHMVVRVPVVWCSGGNVRSNYWVPMYLTRGDRRRADNIS